MEEETKPKPKPKPKKKHLLPELITPAQYAKEMDVARVTVYSHLRDGKIEVILVGRNKDIYIDFNVYKDHVFELKHRANK